MKTQGPRSGTGFCPRRSESDLAMGPKRSVTARSAEDRCTGEITTERMPANQESVKRILFGGVVGGVIDPAVRPIRSVTTGNANSVSTQKIDSKKEKYRGYIPHSIEKDGR